MVGLRAVPADLAVRRRGGVATDSEVCGVDGGHEVSIEGGLVNMQRAGGLVAAVPVHVGAEAELGGVVVAGAGDDGEGDRSN
jgi:hypothetical protein